MGDRVFFRISPWKGVLRFGKKDKLSPRYMGPYEIVERIGEIVYWLRLPLELAFMFLCFESIWQILHMC